MFPKETAGIIPGRRYSKNQKSTAPTKRQREVAQLTARLSAAGWRQTPEGGWHQGDLEDTPIKEE